MGDRSLNEGNYVCVCGALYHGSKANCIIIKSVSIGFLILTIQCDMSTIMPPGVECVLDG